MGKKTEKKYKKGVSPRLLDLCAGSDLDKYRLADKVPEACKVQAVIKENDGQEVEASEWLRLHKKSLNA